MKNWLALSVERKRDIFNQTAEQTGLPAAAIEKDWWVTATLKALFSLSISEHLVFKGGTSLSKAYNLIERFSEDIDIGLNRELLGFSGELTKTQIKKLKRESYLFVSNEVSAMLQKQLITFGIYEKQFAISSYQTDEAHPDHDPQQLFVQYDSIVDKSDYLKEQVVVEISSRSQFEPVENKMVNAIVFQSFPDASFSDSGFDVLTISPRRTFLEKAILLHEEFQKPEEKFRPERMSRHLYDLEKLMDTDFGISSTRDKQLFETIVAHRKVFTPIPGVDYDSLAMCSLDFIPPSQLMATYEADYRKMTEAMIYGSTLSFDKLLDRLKQLQQRFRK